MILRFVDFFGSDICIVFVDIWDMCISYEWGGFWGKYDKIRRKYYWFLVFLDCKN